MLPELVVFLHENFLDDTGPPFNVIIVLWTVKLTFKLDRFQCQLTVNSCDYSVLV